MSNLFIYLIELNLAISIFYILYVVLFKKDSNFNNRRAYLFLAMIITFIVPFIKINFLNPESFLNSTLITLEEFVLVAGKQSAEISNISFSGILTVVYLSIALFFLGRCIISIVKVLIYSKQSEKAELNGISVRLNNRLHASSFFNIIFIDQEAVEEQNVSVILEHELFHVRLFHSLDRILSELFLSINWFNPISWMLKKAIIVNHEYQADNRVIEHGTDHISYQLAILNQYIGSASISNQFSNQIKNRINMLNKNYKKGSFWKSLIIFPLSMVLLFFLACEKQEGTDEDSFKKSTSEELYYIVEEMPAFNGGDPGAEFGKYIGNNLEYPALAIEKGISGTVVVQFTVNCKGSVEDAVVVRSVDPVLDKEAVRVIMSSPSWTPGKQKGKAVGVLFTFPIKFKLQ